MRICGNELVLLLFLATALTSHLPIFVLTIIDDESSVLPYLFVEAPIYTQPTCCLWENVTCTHWELNFGDGSLQIFFLPSDGAASFLVPIFVISSYVLVNDNGVAFKEGFTAAAQKIQSLKLGEISSPTIRTVNICSNNTESICEAERRETKGKETKIAIITEERYGSEQKEREARFWVERVKREIEHKKIHQWSLAQPYYYGLLQDAVLVKQNIADKKQFHVLGDPPWKRELFASSADECWDDITSPKCAFVIGTKELKILGKIGSGFHGFVYRVYSRDGNLYALKHVLPRRDPIFSETEQVILRELSTSEHVVRTYDMINTYQGLFILMEYGHYSLWDAIQDKDPLSLAQIRIYFRQMVQAVHAVHTHSIVHMDVKPNNFVFFRGKIKIIDFESAVYRKPEMAARFGYKLEDADFTMDIHGLGMSLYIMITKQSSTLVWYNKIPKAVRGYQSVSAGVNMGASNDSYRDLQSLLEGCMHKNRTMRLSITEILSHPFLSVH